MESRLPIACGADELWSLSADCVYCVWSRLVVELIACGANCVWCLSIECGAYQLSVEPINCVWSHRLHLLGAYRLGVEPIAIVCGADCQLIGCGADRCHCLWSR